MKKILNIIIALTLSIAVVSCTKTAEEPKFSVDRTEIAADYEGGTASVVVNSNQDWKLIPGDEYTWLTANKTSGSGTDDILFSFEANNGGERSAVFAISTKGFFHYSITITQEAAKSNIKFGKPSVKEAPLQGVADAFKIAVPYSGAMGTEDITFSMAYSGSSEADFTTDKFKTSDFKAGAGEVIIPVHGTPSTLGPVKVTVTVSGEELEPVTARVCEKFSYAKYISWNFWAVGYTRSDFNLLRGSSYDYSFTSEAIHATTSGKGEDHKVLPARTNMSGCENAYLSIWSANDIVAAGQASGPSGTPSGLAGYQFNPGLQIQGFVENDYMFVYIPKVSIAAGGKIYLESAIGGAKAASNAFIAEYSTDGNSWKIFDNPKSMDVEGAPYQYHFAYNTSYDTRYSYGHSTAVDPTYDKVTATVSSAINGQLYVRLRANGVNGGGAVQTGTGWSDIKFFDVSFD